ncbi:hypothetical protein [Orenia marismortui]|uniref:hypothetical protein n=1 Tax=Orenia marismortui TaxID=46469 RepID=UPI00036761F1|nr:hypothetical protein [Orenia marismortui]
MAYSTESGVSSNKKSFKDYLKIGVMIALAIWIFTIANNANNLATKNQYFIKKPTYEISYIAGGPKRFANRFKDYLSNTDKKINNKDYLWSTLIIENTGNKDAKNIKIEDFAAIDIAKIGVSEPGYGYNEVKIDYKKKEKQAIITLEELPTSSKVYVFIAMKPEEIKQPYDQNSQRVWAKVYDTYQEKIVVTSSSSEKTTYYSGYSNLYN